MNKSQILDMINENKIDKEISDKELDELSLAKESSKKESDTKETVKRTEKLSKLLVKAIDFDLYKEELTKLTEKSSDVHILSIFEKDIEKFISSKELTLKDYQKYVDSYGAIKAVVEYQASGDDATFKKMSEKKIYKTLAVFIYNSDTSVKEDVIKKARKSAVALNKPLSPKKVTKPKKSSVVEAPEEEDNEDAEEEEDDD
jgi:hypothetical protein